MEENKSRNNISCRKLAAAYFEETGDKISKTYIHNLLKNNFHLSYLKSTVKNIKINTPFGVFSALFFIKSVIKCMSLGYKVLFLDETYIQSINNNYRAWHSKKEDLYFNLGTKKKKNLLLVVSSNSVFHYKISEDKTNENNFFQFMNEVNTIIKSKENEKYIIVMDNLSAHRTKKLMKYYDENKINIIFNCVYRSNFNCVELAFKIMKIQLYNKLFQNIEEVTNFIKDKLEEINLNGVLRNNFYETLNIYFDFYQKYKDTDLNLLMK